MTKEVATEVLSRLETLSGQVQTKVWPVLLAEMIKKATFLTWAGSIVIAIGIVSVTASLLFSAYSYRKHEVLADSLGITGVIEFIVGAILLCIGIGWTLSPNIALIKSLF